MLLIQKIPLLFDHFQNTVRILTIRNRPFTIIHSIVLSIDFFIISNMNYSTGVWGYSHDQKRSITAFDNSIITENRR